MLDDPAYELADRLYEPIRRQRDRQLSQYIESATSTAASKGTLGLGLFHKSLAGRHVDELRQRADSLLYILKQVATTSTAPTNSASVSRLSEYLTELIREDAESLASQLGPLLTRFDSKSDRYVAEIADEVPRVVDKLQAELELFVRQQDARRVLETAVSDASEVLPDPRRVFVVHGRDDTLAADRFAFLDAIGLQPIAWRDAVRQTGKGSPYVGEILEGAFATAQAVVVLLSPDDEVRLAPSLVREDDQAIEREVRLQPRPNVLFEAGMAFGCITGWLKGAISVD